MPQTTTIERAPVSARPSSTRLKLPVRIHQAAEAEIKEAADFYDIESLGLGGELTDEIEHAVEH